MARTPYGVFSSSGPEGPEGPEGIAAPVTPPKSALEGALDNKRGTATYYRELDIVRMILTREIGTKEQHAALVRIIKQNEPKKYLAQKLASRLGDNSSVANIQMQDQLT